MSQRRGRVAFQVVGKVQSLRRKLSQVEPSLLVQTSTCSVVVGMRRVSVWIQTFLRSLAHSIITHVLINDHPFVAGNTACLWHILMVRDFFH